MEGRHACLYVLQEGEGQRPDTVPYRGRMLITGDRGGLPETF